MLYVGKCAVSCIVSLLFVSLFLVDLNILLPLAIDFELAAGLIIGFAFWAGALMHLLLANRWQTTLLSYVFASIALGALFLVLR